MRIEVGNKHKASESRNGHDEKPQQARQHQTQVPVSHIEPGNEASDVVKRPFEKPLPQKSRHAMTRYHFGFGRRTLVFVASVIILCSFLWFSFLAGNDTGKWFADISKGIMDVTLLPLVRLISMPFSSSITAMTVFNGLIGLSDIEAVNIVLAIFVVSLAISVITAIIADIVMSVRLSRDEGSVAMTRGYQQRYSMYQRLR